MHPDLTRQVISDRVHRLTRRGARRIVSTPRNPVRLAAAR